MTATSSWYHCSVKVISRGSGRTAIAAAAYRAGAKLRDRQTEQVHDYTRRSGVIETFIVAPENAPIWSHNLEDLWNAAQEADHRKNSTMAREVELALPSALDGTDRAALAREFALHLVDRYGVAVSVALHEPSKHGDDRNYHAHLLMTTRRMDAGGLSAKTRELDGGRQEVKHIREYAATLINQYLEDAGFDERVDHRSFVERGINQEPTKHLGPEASAMERRGEESRISDENREITEHNRQVDALVSELAAIDAEIAAEMAEDFLPTGQDDEELEYQIEALQLQEEPSEQSWEEQKRAAQRVFKDENREEGDVQTGEAEQSGLSWEEQKRETQRVFKDEERQEAANPIDQAEPRTLTWEEQKRAAQSAFKEFQITGISNALHLSPSVRAEIDKIRDILSGVIGQQEEPENPQQPFAVEERAPVDLFSSPIVLAFEADIKQRGEITEHGIGRSWIARTGAMFENFYYGTMERIRDTWQKYVGRYTPQSQNRDIELDR